MKIKLELDTEDLASFPWKNLSTGHLIALLELLGDWRQEGWQILEKRLIEENSTKCLS